MFSFGKKRPQNNAAAVTTDSSSLTNVSISDIIGAGSSVGIHITPAKAIGVVTVFACVQWRASMLAHLPIHLLKKEGAKRETVNNHPVAMSLMFPHDEINRVDLITALEAAHALYNEAYCQIVRNQLGQVMGFVPITPSRVERRRVNQNGQVDPAGRIVYVIDGRKVLERAEILHIKGISFDGINPLRFSDYGKECIGLAIALDRDAGLTFSENVRFPNLLVSDLEMSEQAYNRMLSWLKKGTGRLFGRLKSVILDAGVKPWEPKRNYQELEFDQSRTRQQLSICQMMRVPPHKVGILDKSGKANIEAQQIEAVTDVIAPIACQFEAEFMRALTRSEIAAGYYVKFNLNALLRGTMKDRADYYTSLSRIRALTPNEVRELEDMNPYPGGDEFYGPMNEETATQTINRPEDDED